MDERERQYDGDRKLRPTTSNDRTKDGKNRESAHVWNITAENIDAIVDSTAAQYEADTDKIDIHVQNAKQDIPVFTEITADALFEKVRQIFEYSLHNETISRFHRMMTIEQFRSPELAALYSRRYVERILRYHAGIFRALIASGEICAEDPDVLAMMYVSPVLTLIGICDRQPEREPECLEKLQNHVQLFFRMVHGSSAQRGEGHE